MTTSQMPAILRYRLSGSAQLAPLACATPPHRD